MYVAKTSDSAAIEEVPIFRRVLIEGLHEIKQHWLNHAKDLY